MSLAPEAAASGSPVAVGGRITVDVAGKVRRPGIAVLDSGSRVVDAIKAAGGARPGVDTSGLNLARVLVDGEQIVVGGPAAAAPPVAPVPGAPSATGPLVNLNLATQAELETLPEVGPVTAQSILTWRDQHGGFTDVAELLEVDGIGDATLAQITPYVTL
jgi:competence protein ComEA